ncbi:MAG: HD domain-containing phosphohydrolase [Nitriliruptor sp.]|uniref:HD-GYP domain-containing protein n=1 Tax=Nitriliruptor sp. TaxID=2448056 RepID=UPI0034A00E30
MTGSSRARLVEATGCEIAADGDTSDTPVALIVVSTRMPLGQVSAAVATFRRTPDVPVVAIVHAGGEELAAQLLRAGAVGLVAEGNEAAVAGFVGGDASDASLVETYEQRLGRARPSDLGVPGHDPVTGLPTLSEFDAALTEAGQSGEVPRVGFARVLSYEDAARRLSSEASHLLRRRLSTQLREIGRLYGAELYSSSPTDFAFIAPDLSSEDAGAMGQMLARAAETFAPSGSRSLGLAVGHAGREVTSEVAALRELAQRALDLASTGTESVVLSADDLSRTLAATTELEVLLRLVDSVEAQQPNAAGRGPRVGELAARLAQHLGFDGVERSQFRLAGHLHEIGKVSLSGAALEAGESAEGELAGEYQRYPELGSEYLRVSAGPEVATAVRHHRERWDGTGFPAGSAGEEIPVGARIVAVAVAFDAAGQRPAKERSDAIGAVYEAADTRFDPTVVMAAQALFGDADTR